MPAVARILARHDRGKLAAFVTIAIDLLDVMEGDEDAEPATWTEAGNRNTHADLPDDYEQSGDEPDKMGLRLNGEGCNSILTGDDQAGIGRPSDKRASHALPRLDFGTR